MILSLIGNVERKDRPWDARTASPVLSFLGNTVLDFRTAALGEGETEVVIVGVIGNTEVIVPEDLPVLVTGATAVGNREAFGESTQGLGHGADHATPDFHTAAGRATGGPVARRLRLSIFRVIGNVAVHRVPVAVPMAV
jgi:lia operon protein LiaF